MQRPLFTGHSGSTGPAGRADHAIVIGGSMAGLLAARVLADHVDRVTVIERDRFPAAPSPRAGVPQGWHTHVMLLHGKQVLERLFPGLDAELAAAGAPSMDLIGEFLVLGIGGWTCRFPSPFVLRPCSRPLLEGSVRRRLAEHPAIRLVEETQVVGLVADAARSRVTGVRLRARGAGGGPDYALAAALVVDASGRASRTPAWLGDLGYTPPRETVINAFLGYASRVYEAPIRPTRPTGPRRGRPRWKGLLVTAKAPDCRRGGVIWPLEHGRWLVSLMGIARDYPPTDEAGFLDFARTLRSPILHEAITEARPLTPIHGYRRTENRLRHYECLARWPDGFVVTGDAVCAFNPIYGQGMTTAALGAAALDRCLRQVGAGRPGLSRRFQGELARVTATPWLMATGEDFRWPSTEGGHPTLQTRLLHRYMDQILYLNTRSTAAAATFSQVAHLLAPPTILFTPSLIAQVLGRALLT